MSQTKEIITIPEEGQCFGMNKELFRIVDVEYVTKSGEVVEIKLKIEKQ